jgi:hypothetical protein
MIDAGLPWRGGDRRPLKLGALVFGLGRELLRSAPRSSADMVDLARLAGARGSGTGRALIGLARELIRRWPCFTALSRAWLNYRPRSYGGPVLIVRACPEGRIGADDPLVATVRPHLAIAPVIAVVSAAHLKLLGRKSVTALAQAIAAGMTQLEGRSP